MSETSGFSKKSKKSKKSKHDKKIKEELNSSKSQFKSEEFVNSDTSSSESDNKFSKRASSNRKSESEKSEGKSNDSDSDQNATLKSSKESEKIVKVNKKTIAENLYKSIIDPDTSSDDETAKNNISFSIRKSNFNAMRPMKNDIETFLKMHPKVEISKGKKPNNPELKLDDIGLNEEIWILQCPKTINIAQLLGKKLNLNDTTNIKGENIECLSEYFTKEKSLTMFCNDKSVEIKPSGKLIVHEKIEMSETNFDNYEKDTQNFPFPKNLKVRHPLLGAEYKEYINLTDDVKHKLLKASISKMKASKKIKKEVIIKTELSEENNSVEDNFLPKKRKLSNSESDRSHNLSQSIIEENKLNSKKIKKLAIESPDKSLKKQKKLKLSNDDVSNDLEWLKSI